MAPVFPSGSNHSPTLQPCPARNTIHIGRGLYLGFKLTQKAQGLLLAIFWAHQKDENKSDLHISQENRIWAKFGYFNWPPENPFFFFFFLSLSRKDRICASRREDLGLAEELLLAIWSGMAGADVRRGFLSASRAVFLWLLKVYPCPQKRALTER